MDFRYFCTLCSGAPVASRNEWTECSDRKLAALRAGWKMAGKYQREDFYYRQAKSEGYRSRAAYKLIELDKSHRLIHSASRVLDLGCAPGGWLQVAAERVGPKGMVIGVDLESVPPISGGPNRVEPILVQGDMLDSGVQDEIFRLADGPVDVVLSDMSPKLSGIRFRDVARASELVEIALLLADRLLRPGGALVAKVFPGQESNELVPLFRQRFEKFQRCNLDSTRKSSTEQYFVGKGFRQELMNDVMIAKVGGVHGE